MIFTETKIKGAFVIEPSKLKDSRGFFSRMWCKKEFETRGLVSNFVQFNMSFNNKMGTLRGLHYQITPYKEVKVVRCTKGAIYDVIVDIRSESPTFKQWFGIELRNDSYKMVYVPEGVAHGFQTLEDDSEIFYQVSQFHSPEHERGLRWDDKMFSVEWPETGKRIISDKDKNLQNYSL